MDTTAEIYPMPSFPILNVTDLAASARWYQEALGFHHAPPADKPWNARECTIADPDGYQLTFSQPINMGRSFDDVIQEARKAAS